MIDAYLRIEAVVEDEMARLDGGEADELGELLEVLRRLKEARVSFEDGQRRLPI